MTALEKQLARARQIRELMKYIIAIFLVLYTSGAVACSLPIYTEPFVIDKKLKLALPVKPKFKVSKFPRGTKSKTSCSVLAFLFLKPEKTIEQQGYTFKVIKGTFNPFHSIEPLQRSEEHKLLSKEYEAFDEDEFVFHFYEILNNPIDIVLQITAISKSGGKSEPQLLKIKHNGRILIAPKFP